MNFGRNFGFQLGEKPEKLKIGNVHKEVEVI